MCSIILQLALTNRRVFIYTCIYVHPFSFRPPVIPIRRDIYFVSMLEKLKIKIYCIIYLIFRQLLLVGHFQFFPRAI